MKQKGVRKPDGKELGLILADLDARIARVESKMEMVAEAPVPEIREDRALLIGLIDAMVHNGHITEQEIQDYTSRYRSILAGLTMLILDKELANRKELNCWILTFHHLIRTARLVPGLAREETEKEKQLYFQQLMASSEPFEIF